MGSENARAAKLACGLGILTLALHSEWRAIGAYDTVALRRGEGHERSLAQFRSSYDACAAAAHMSCQNSSPALSHIKKRSLSGVSVC